MLRFCVGDRFYLCENKVVCQYDYEEHILPIQSSLLVQPIDRPSSDQPPELISQSVLSDALNAPEAFSISMNLAFAIQNDDNSTGERADFHSDKMIEQPALQDGNKDVAEEKIDDILLDEADISKKDGSDEVRVVHEAQDQRDQV